MMNSNFFQNRSLLKNVHDVLVTPTYNLAEYGKDLFIPITSTPTQLKTFTNNSGTIILRNTFTAPNSITGEEIDDYPSVIANEDTLLAWCAADDADYNRTFRYSPDVQAVLSKAYMNVAFIMNISAWTAGTCQLSSVDVEIIERANDSGVGDRVVFSNRYATAHAALGAAGTQIFILSAVFGDVNITKNLPLDFRFRVNTTQASKNFTYQTGIVPFFAYNVTSAVKPYSLSGIGMHVNADFDNAQAVMRKSGSETKGYYLNDFGSPKGIGS